jgi:hypothetical protein
MAATVGGTSAGHRLGCWQLRPMAGWLTRKGTAIDIGCGLGIEAAYLASGHYDRNPVGGKSPNRTRAAHRSWR